MALSENIWLDIKKSDQYRAVNDLILESQPNSNYYTLLILSSIIIASGLLLTNSAILIGGMLVTPLLTPILLVSLGVTLGRPFLIHKTSLIILKSVVVIFAVSFMFGLIFVEPNDKEFFSAVLLNNQASSAFLYFLVAFVSGIAATFAWVRKKVTNMLPGISIAVSLVPPVSMMAILLAQNNIEVSKFFLMVFLFNMVGLVMGSMIVFSMLKFYRVGDHIDANINNLKKEEAEKKQFKEKEKYENTEKIK